MSGKKRSRSDICQLRLLPFGEVEPAAGKLPRKARRVVRRDKCGTVCRQLQGEVADFIRHWAEVPSPLLVADEVERLHGATFDELRKLGLLVAGGMSAAVGCEACEHDHAEWIEAVRGPDGEERFFIDCPEKGRVEVARRRLQHWAVDFTPLARGVKEGLRGFGILEAVVPGRLWRLGKAALAGRTRDLWMLRQPPAGRGPAAAGSVIRPDGAVVFILGRTPADGLRELGEAALFDVHKVVHLGGAGFHVDRHAVERRLRSEAAAGEAAATQLLCCCG